MGSIIIDQWATNSRDEVIKEDIVQKKQPTTLVIVATH